MFIFTVVIVNLPVVIHHHLWSGYADPDEPFPAPSFMAWDVETPVALYMASTGPLAQPPVTVMTALQLAAVKHPNKPAYGKACAKPTKLDRIYKARFNSTI